MFVAALCLFPQLGSWHLFFSVLIALFFVYDLKHFPRFLLKSGLEKQLAAPFRAKFSPLIDFAGIAGILGALAALWQHFGSSMFETLIFFATSDLTTLGKS